MKKEKTVEIIFGNSTYGTMKKSGLSKNKIIMFNTLFSVSDLSTLSEYKLITKKSLSYENEYIFKEEVQKLKKYILNGYKIRIWSSHKDIEPYLLLLYICDLFSENNITLYVTFSEELNQAPSPACLRKNELELLTEKEHKLTKEEIKYNSFLWKELVKVNSEMRVLKNEKVLSVSFDYYDEAILKKLKSLGKVSIAKIVAELIAEYHTRDIEYTYFIDNLIKKNKIKIAEKSKERHFLDIIDIVN